MTELKVNAPVDVGTPWAEIRMPGFGEVTPVRSPDGKHGFIMSIDTLAEFNKGVPIGGLTELIKELERVLA